MPRLATTAVVLVTLLGGVAGCNRAAPVDPAPATNPPTTGAVCDDDPGDLSRDAGQLGGNLKQPAGVDLVHAEARVTDASLQVDFVTAGPIAGTPGPEFRVAQGPAGQLESWELVAMPGDAAPGGAGAPWQVSLITFRQSDRGIVEAPRAVLPVAVDVRGETLSFEVARRDLPRIATYVWQFGSSATSDPAAGDTIIDDCERYGGASGTVPPATGTIPPASAAPATGG